VKLFLLGALVSAAPLLAQTAILQIKVVEGEGGVHPAGSRAGHLVVEVTDEVGRPVEGATVGFQLPEDGPSGVFATGLRSEIGMTDARGRAGVRNFRVNRLPGPFEIRVTAAKDSVRAGMLSRQYVAGAKGSVAGTPSGSSRRKWYIIAAVAAGVAASGAVVSSGGSTPAPAAVPAPPPLSIGAPSISIGKP
jgi:hypothetical protein